MAKAGKEVVVTLETLLSGEVSEEQVHGLSFEQALKLLEEVVTSVESGSLPLDRAIGSYEHGTVLIKHLRKLLSGAEEKLRVLNQA
jgi:exodeoxyribonuclease VII small subunit